MTPCQNPHCNKPAISFSDYCGAHTDNEVYAHTLNALDEKEYSELFISDVEVEGVHLEDMIWYDCTIEDCAFGDSSFINLGFNECTFRDSFFTKVEFRQRGITQDSVLASTTFEQCRFIDYHIFRSTLSNVYFQNGTIIRNNKWHHLQLANTDIMQGSVVDGLDIQFCVFDHCSFQEADVRQLKANEVKIKVSFAHNARFYDCHLTRFESDLEDIDLPAAICIFHNCNIDKSIHIKGFANWNGVGEEAELLYYRLLDRIEEVVHIDNLQPVTDLVDRLYDGEQMDYDLARRLQRIFIKYFDHVKQSGDLAGLGTIAGLISRLPPELIIDKSQYLPAPSALNHKNLLRMDIKKEVNSLADLQVVINRLQMLEAAVEAAGYGKIVLEDFKKGSVTVVISSTLAALILIITLLYKAGHLFLNTENLILSNQQLKRQKKLAKKEAQKLDQEIEINQQQIILNAIEIEKRKKEMQSQNLPDTHISVTPEEVAEYAGEDPFDRLELQPMHEVKQAAERVLDLGETNVYVEMFES